MKSKTLLLLLLAIVGFSACNTFRLNDQARHRHLHKVPVNMTVTVAEPQPEETPVVVVEEKQVLPESVPVVITDAEEQDAAGVRDQQPDSDRKEVSMRKIVKKLPSLQFAKKAAANAVPGDSTDAVTLLIWVLIIALILALLSIILPGLLEIFLVLLLVVLVVMAIMYLAGNV